MKKIATFLLAIFIILSYNTFGQQLITNGDFEAGNTGWGEIGDFHLAVAQLNCYNSASKYAYFSTDLGGAIPNGTGFIYQSVTIPAYTTSWTCSFYTSVSSSEATTGAYDIMKIGIKQTLSGAYLVSKTFSNLNGTAPTLPRIVCANYVRQTLTLPASLQNQPNPIAVYFYAEATTDIDGPTLFRIDDVSIIATTTPPTLQPPTVTAITGAANCINVGWTSVSGATYYELYRDGNYVGQYPMTLTANCDLVANSNHCYQVKACSTTQCSNFSNNSCANAGQSTGTNRYTVTLARNPFNGGTVSGGGTFDAGSSVSMSATENTGWTFVNWTDDAGIVYTQRNNVLSPLIRNVTFTANFRQINTGGTYTVTVLANPSIGGTATLSNGTNTGTFPLNSSVSMTATENRGWTFVNWTDDAGAIYAQQNNVLSPLTRNVTLTANFREVGNNGGNNSLPVCNSCGTIEMITPHPIKSEYNKKFPADPAFAFRKVIDGSNLTMITTTPQYELYLADVNGNRLTINDYENTASLKMKASSLEFEFENGDIYGYRLKNDLSENKTYKYVIIARGSDGRIYGCASGLFTVNPNVTKINDGDTYTGDLDNYDYETPKRRIDELQGHLLNINSYFNGSNGNNCGRWQARVYSKCLNLACSKRCMRTIHMCTEYTYRFYKNFWDIDLLKSGVYGSYVARDYNDQAITKKYMGLIETGQIKATNLVIFEQESHIAAVYKDNITRIQQNSGSKYVGATIPQSNNVKYLRPKLIQLYNVSSKLVLSSIPNSPIIISNPTPSLMWTSVAEAYYEFNLKVFDEQIKCFVPISGYSSQKIIGNKCGIQIMPTPLQAGLYSGRVKAILKNNIGTVVSPQFFFRINPNATNQIVPLQPNILNNTFVGSYIANASLNIRQDSTWYNLGYSDENGKLKSTSDYFLSNTDSLEVVANGYYPMRFKLDDSLIQKQSPKYPLFKDVSQRQRLINPSIETNTSPITNQRNIQVKVKAENLVGFQYYRHHGIEPDSGDVNYTNYTFRDTVLNVQLDTGYNSLEFVLFNNFDTVILRRDINFIPTDSIITNTFTINLNVTANVTDAYVYVDGDFYKRISGNTILQVYRNPHNITISKIGFEDLALFIENDTTLQITLTPRIEEPWSVPMLFDQNRVLYRNNASLKSTGLGSNYNLGKSNPNYSNLRLIPKSGTYKLERQSGNRDTIAMLAILDQPDYPTLDSTYVLNKKNAVFKKIFANQFADSIVYDSSIQKLGHFKLYDNSEELVLMKKQKPIKNTSTGFRVHQSETLTIPLSDLFKDPDALPNDMTYSFVTDSSFSFLIVGDSVRLKHINCKSGNLSFTVKATHDQLSVSDTFNIYITPLSITQTVRPAKCFGTATGKIEISTSSDKPQLYSYLWSNSVNTRINDSILAGTYRITVNDQNNCKTLKTIEVTQPTVLTVNLGADIKLDLGDSTQLTPSVNRALLQSWKWTPSEGLSCNTCEKPYARPLQTTEYKLVAIDTSNCSGNDIIRVFVANKEKVFIPNAFSPNQDGVNDILFVNCGNEVRKINKFYIFNRWGAQVFAANNFLPNDEKFGWNGTFKGVAAAEGVYIYTVEVEYINGKTQIFSGDVNIIK